MTDQINLVDKSGKRHMYIRTPVEVGCLSRIRNHNSEDCEINSEDCEITFCKSI